MAGKETLNTFVAVDFGTTFSGLAFAIGPDSKDIFIQPQSGCQNRKMPTALLLDKHGKLDSFGKPAMEKYFNLEEDEMVDWFYFDRFKMLLKDESVSER